MIYTIAPRAPRGDSDRRARNGGRPTEAGAHFITCRKTRGGAVARTGRGKAFRAMRRLRMKAGRRETALPHRRAGPRPRGVVRQVSAGKDGRRISLMLGACGRRAAEKPLQRRRSSRSAGTVVKTPNATSAAPSRRRAGSDSLPESSRPAPAARAARVPTTKPIWGTVRGCFRMSRPPDLLQARSLPARGGPQPLGSRPGQGAGRLSARPNPVAPIPPPMCNRVR